MWGLNFQTKNQTRTPWTALGKFQEKNIWMGFGRFILDKLCSTARSHLCLLPCARLLILPADLPCKRAGVTCVSAPCTILLLVHLSDLLFVWKF